MNDSRSINTHSTIGTVANGSELGYYKSYSEYDASEKVIFYPTINNVRIQTKDQMTGNVIREWDSERSLMKTLTQLVPMVRVGDCLPEVKPMNWSLDTVDVQAAARIFDVTFVDHSKGIVLYDRGVTAKISFKQLGWIAESGELHFFVGIKAIDFIKALISMNVISIESNTVMI